MQIPQIRMESAFAKINITGTLAQQTIEQPKAQLDLQQPKAEMIIHRSQGQLSIDQTIAWESMDIKHIFRRIEEHAQKGYNDLLSGIARTASEGDELMRIEHGGGAIASQAARNSELFNYNYNIGFTPPPFSVKINYQPGHLDIQAEPQKVVNNTVARKPMIDYQKGDITYQMKQQPSLKIDVVNIP
ncbi:DUF6470 family protein [Bacillus sp. DTU_2020_1000418_1_SI_GHA_SEK_038]|uniref:DUF6470 family protein n=1 Tax=Bacillus sp. DTU_2020_1000418_1_SI_GHA_SEK_038 TaxID=3077585 RepID=UPI0028E74EB8|nr:DUF6470 family protein [Bacillus sp. DTU_2020_1000418_1_SI_GHA_SEK_038]WNS75088.1 DUF6470 family protein [Bacillus sp. DTU_2020_1000418_1_SI_GHA_SEK_038]